MTQADTLDQQLEAATASQQFVAGGGLPSIADRIASRFPNVKKLVRYGSTSVLALVISEVMLLLLYANNVAGATVAALLANLSGTIPSYFLSRYWIWSDAKRDRPGRQVAFYWAVSLASMVISSIATGQISHHTPKERVVHLLLLASAYLVVSIVLWVAKYVVYERTIFKSVDSNIIETATLS